MGEDKSLVTTSHNTDPNPYTYIYKYTYIKTYINGATALCSLTSHQSWRRVWYKARVCGVRQQMMSIYTICNMFLHKFRVYINLGFA